jgi:hypothetical protein
LKALRLPTGWHAKDISNPKQFTNPSTLFSSPYIHIYSFIGGRDRSLDLTLHLHCRPRPGRNNDVLKKSLQIEYQLIPSISSTTLWVQAPCGMQRFVFLRRQLSLELPAQIGGTFHANFDSNSDDLHHSILSLRLTTPEIHLVEYRNCCL